MAKITQNLIEIQNVSSGVYYPFELSEYAVEYNKLWRDADRNMNGDVRATLIGVFPKLICKSAPLKRANAGNLAALLSQPYFNVKYFDTITGGVVSAQFYANDPSTELLNRCGEWYDETSFNLIPVSKR